MVSNGFHNPCRGQCTSIVVVYIPYMLFPVMGCDEIDNGMAVLARGSHGNACIKSRYVEVLRNGVPFGPDTL
jgi:hypothetical protein